MQKLITGHMVVRNEERWVWFAIKSVIDYLDELIIYDTGSEDKTVEIIKSIDSGKIKFSQKGSVNRKSLVELRNKQIRETHTPWFLIIDGDEVWPKENIKKLILTVEKLPEEKKAVVVRTRNCVGDIYHYQSELAGEYKILGMKGHFNTRAFRNGGLTVKGEYPLEAYCDQEGPLNSQDEKLHFLDTYYLHMTHMPRSSKREYEASVIDRLKKIKIEKGIEFKKGEPFPEIFNLKRPEIVPDPFVKLTLVQQFIVEVLTPLKNLKRSLKRLL